MHENAVSDASTVCLTLADRPRKYRHAHPGPWHTADCDLVSAVAPAAGERQERQSFTIRESATAVAGKGMVTSGTKTGKIREVAVPPPVSVAANR